ncbi:hypothetical protein REPUB_Repub03eG0012800 [Reevesia pubescens]
MVLMPRKKKVGSVPVYLNVYDLTPINGYAYWFGLGIYHSGVQVHGVEYGFGAHEHSTTGIFEVEPRQCPGFTFRKSILIGRTDLGPKDVRAFMEKLAREYCGNTYHLITKNCNHFCNDVCIQLTGKPIPRWVNRLARLEVFKTMKRWYQFPASSIPPEATDQSPVLQALLNVAESWKDIGNFMLVTIHYGNLDALGSSNISLSMRMRYRVRTWVGACPTM